MFSDSDISKTIENELDISNISKLTKRLEKLYELAKSREETLTALTIAGINVKEPFSIERENFCGYPFFTMCYANRIFYSTRYNEVSARSYTTIVRLYLKFGSKFYDFMSRFELFDDANGETFPKFNALSLVSNYLIKHVHHDVFISELLSGAEFDCTNIVDENFHALFDGDAEIRFDFMRCLKIMYKAGIEKSFYKALVSEKDATDANNYRPVSKENIQFYTKKIGIFEFAKNWDFYKKEAIVSYDYLEFMRDVINLRNNIVDEETREFLQIRKKFFKS